MKKFYFFCTFIFFVGITGAEVQYPGPQGYVSDYANVISTETKEKITSIISELEQKTSAEIAIVTVKTLEGITIEEYSVKLFEKFGIGKKDKNNGVLLIVATKDRKARIEVGYGLEGILPDGLCGEILDKYVIPDFKQGDYDKGLLFGTSMIASIIAKDANVELTGVIASPSVRTKKISVFKIIFNLIIIIIAIIAFIRNPFLFMLFLGTGGFRGGSGRGGFSGGFGGGGGFSGGGGASRGW